MSTAVPEHPTELDRFVALLLKQGTISDATLERARRAAHSTGERADRALNQLGLLSDDAMMEAWSEITGLSIISSHDVPERPVLPDLLATAFLRSARCLPITADAKRITLAISDPLDVFTPKAVAARTGRSVDLRLAHPKIIDQVLAIEAQQQTSESALDETAAPDAERLKDLASDAPVIRYVDTLLETAIRRRASDIHLSATRTGTRLRFRIDGVLHEIDPPKSALYPSIISRLKIMAGLDIAERRLPQDGRIRVGVHGREVDLRMASMPHAHGEGVVLRILDRGSVVLDFDKLGLAKDIVTRIRRVLAAPHGLFLVTGPTGSGKTTTLYTALREVTQTGLNLVSVEDPVEYHLDGVNQIQVARTIGLDFAAALRSVLRQDPDVIMVGEIRDAETASVAIQAALTGHLVLATLHTNTAAGAVPRLIDMGAEPFLIASCLRGVLSQRLVRRICIACHGAKTKAACPACSGSGFAGRVAVGEFLDIDPELQSLIRSRPDEKTVQTSARKSGMRTLADDGKAKVRSGLTTEIELARVMETL
jgi:type II secretory ATPase GspE/PulE/Tfp pilus assembly ATPase PilB-like protein